jgi:hypothetical protein
MSTEIVSSLYKQIDDIANLKSEDLDGGKVISKDAIVNAKLGLKKFIESGIYPQLIVPTQYAGVAFIILYKVVIDFHNNGQIVYSWFENEDIKYRVIDVNDINGSLITDNIFKVN